MKIKVSNMQSTKGNYIANQFIIEAGKSVYFQSYRVVIARNCYGKITLDCHYWDYSRTTAKYRNLFLGETSKETVAKIDSGEYRLANLNK